MDRRVLALFPPESFTQAVDGIVGTRRLNVSLSEPTKETRIEKEKACELSQFSARNCHRCSIHW